MPDFVSSQKAPSTKRCIKMRLHGFGICFKLLLSQKAPSTKRCIKTVDHWRRLNYLDRMSESTERQKVH